ncbi:unnamed protein product [Adineta steineri]|uniref:Uncharacterized protein n=1 Tax=Adineta steineri TaxID=433720 RepID=A0A819EEJ5_9BILA|nr:unnamed protein product [Adineta steineri]
MTNSAMDALASAGLMPLPPKSEDEHNIHAAINAIAKDLTPIFDELEAETKIEDKQIAEAILKVVPYPTLVDLKSIIDEQESAIDTTIQSPPIEPLEIFLTQRATTIKGLQTLRASMAKHIRNCRISNTVGNSASIIGGTLCFFFPTIGVPILLAGSATSLGTAIAGNIIEKRLQKKYTDLLEKDSLAVQICESNLKDITTWLVTIYSLGYSVSKAGANFLQLAEAIHASSTLSVWSELISQLPSLSTAFATGAKTAGTISGQILGISLIISVADLIQTWILKNATLEAIDKDIALLEQQLIELKQIVEVYRA